MAGLFGFGGKTKYVDEPNQPQQNGKKELSFLSQTMPNLSAI